MARCSARKSPRWAGTAASGSGVPVSVGDVGPGHRSSRSWQSRQCPESATCVTSSAKPASAASRSARPAMTSGGDLGDGAAAVADQVHVLVLVHRVVRRAVPEVGVAHQPQPFEQVQAAVDRGDVHRRGLALHLRADLLGGRVAEGADGVEHELALRCHPQPAFVQRAAERRGLPAVCCVPSDPATGIGEVSTPPMVGATPVRVSGRPTGCDRRRRSPGGWLRPGCSVRVTSAGGLRRSWTPRRRERDETFGRASDDG